jgi:hypothetical protein
LISVTTALGVCVSSSPARDCPAVKGVKRRSQQAKTTCRLIF